MYWDALTRLFLVLSVVALLLSEMADRSGYRVIGHTGDYLADVSLVLAVLAIAVVADAMLHRKK